MKTILITGAAGRIGTFLRPELAGKYKLRLSDITPIKNLKPGETFMRADIANMRDALRITKGVDAVVHFGGQSGENTWERILNLLFVHKLHREVERYVDLVDHRFGLGVRLP